jgi:hypothetical protein
MTSARDSSAAGTRTIFLKERSMRDPRYALVIGNAAYGAGMTLRNPVNDARLMSETLSSLGFKVDLKEDLGTAAFAAAIAAFVDRLKTDHAQAGVLYYAGHGAQVGGDNYLVPVGCGIRNRLDLENSALKLETIMSMLGNAVPTSILFLDCCRNNPLPYWEENDSRGLTAGLMSPRPPQISNGSYVAFATMSDAVALDGDGRNSPFSLSLAECITMPDRSVSDVMAKVRCKVRSLTRGRQLPMDWSTLLDSYVFNLVGNREAPPPVDPTAREDEFWRYVQNTSSVQLLDSFLAEFPHGTHYKEAREQRDSLKAKLFRQKLWRSTGKVAAALSVLFVSWLILQTARFSSLPGYDIVGGDTSLPVAQNNIDPIIPTERRSGNWKKHNLANYKGAVLCHLQCLLNRKCIAYTYDKENKTCYPKNDYIFAQKDPEDDEKHTSAYIARPSLLFQGTKQLLKRDIIKSDSGSMLEGKVLDGDGNELTNPDPLTRQIGVRVGTLKNAASAAELKDKFDSDSIFCIALCIKLNTCRAFVHSLFNGRCKLLGEGSASLKASDGSVQTFYGVITGVKPPEASIPIAYDINP